MKTMKKKTRRPNLTIEEKQKIFDMRKDMGLPIAEIATTFNTASSVINRVVNHAPKESGWLTVRKTCILKGNKGNKVDKTKERVRLLDPFSDSTELIQGAFGEVLAEFEKNRKLIAAIKQLIADAEDES